MKEREKRLLRLGLLTLFGLLAIVGFHDVGLQYRDFPLPYGPGINNITASELVFYFWYLVFGGLAAIFLTAAFSHISAPDIIENKLSSFFEWKWFVPVAIGVLLGEILLFQNHILAYTPIADDEATYAFIAQTLLKGHLANPSPGDVEFFANKFIIHSGGLWYGKYPIGHPIVLAPFELIHMRWLAVPLITCVTLLATYAVGCELFSKQQASLAVLLLLLSPHFVFMGATELSYPTSTCMMMLGLLSLLKIRHNTSIMWPLLAGSIWAFELIVRPLPGCLFLPIIGLSIVAFTPGLSSIQKVKSVLVGAVPIGLAIGFLFWVNQSLTGNAIQSGYHMAVSTPGKTQAAGRFSLGLFNYTQGRMSASFGGALLRQNFWLFGWPLSLIFVAFCRPVKHRFLFFGLIAAVYAYRFVAPKTVISTLGPVYVTEAVPLLALATASGMVQLRKWLGNTNIPRGGQIVPSLALASFVVAALCFLPIEMLSIKRSANIRLSILSLVDQSIDGKAIVFANHMVPPWIDSTWAPFPPNPSPDLDGRVIFVRHFPGKDGAMKNFSFWQRRFPGRSAWLLHFSSGGVALKPIHKSDDFLPSAQRGALASTPAKD
jgi:hypothetical protein